MDEERTLMRDVPDVTVLRAASSSNHPCLILYSGPDAGRRFDLAPGEHLVGRAVDAQVQLAMPGVSRRHAMLEVVGTAVVLRDLGSANRTCVNDRPIEDAIALKEGDLVRVDNIVLRFHGPDSLDAKLHDRIYRLATTDPGTGAYNRRHLQDTLDREVTRARRGGHPLAVICFDLDHFKRVNDTHGHAAGDQVLRECVQRVQAELRGGDMLCRSGGEEFALLLPDTGLPEAGVLAERLRAAIAGRPFDITAGLSDDRETVAHPQTISLGVAALTDAMRDGPALLDAADRLLYAAKHAGRNCVVTA
jgi:diguanylate cyclase (GGDEF)-like protein